MKKFVYFLMVGLAVTALQASTVAAQGGDPNMPPPMGDPNMPPPVPADPMGTAMPPMDGEDLPPMDDTDLEALFAPPEGDEGDVPPLDDGSAPPAP